MKQSIRILLLFISITNSIIYLQANETDEFYNYNAVSAHVTDMFRYGEFQTSLFTGRLQVSIPIYTIDDPDFKINIALHYNAEGFKPRKHSGYVGYNWFLEAGGCITREVSGFPDEIRGHRAVINGTNNNIGIEGMYHFTMNNPNIDKNDIFNLPGATNVPTCVFDGFNPNTRCHNIGNGCDYEVDYMPDIFHFNFMGYQGSFLINNFGEVQIISGDFVDVDMSGILADWEPEYLSAHPYYSPDFSQDPNTPGVLPYPKENSTIRIKTNDGYTYIFGGDISKLEYTIGAYDNYSILPPNIYGGYEANPAIVSTWHLAEIIAPNKRSVKYFYKPAIPGHHSGVPGGSDPLWEYNEYFNKFVRYNQSMEVFYLQNMTLPMHITNVADIPLELLCKLAFCRFHNENNSYYIYSMTKTCVLDSICISGSQPLRILFDNSQETQRMYNANNYVNCKNNYQLDSIRILSSNKVIKTANLSYVYKSRTGSNISFNWRFLSSAQIRGVGIYQMAYNGVSYPDLSCEGTTYSVELGETPLMDDYGYYVGSNTLALLQQLTYPTGGHQSYTYDSYQFNRKRKYSIGDGSVVEMFTSSSSGNKHGARIREVKTYDKNNHLVETKAFSYSEGIFFDNLRVYNLTYGDFDLYSEYGWPVRYRADYGFLNTHIGYGKVIESVSNSQATYKNIYKFDTGESTYSSLNDNDLNGMYFCGDNKFGILTGQMFYRSKLRKWGKLLTVENYDSGNHLLKSTHYLYNDILSNAGFCNDTIVTYSYYNSQSVSVTMPLNYTIIPAGRINIAEISKKLYVYPDVLIQAVTKDYSQEDSLTTTRTYSYDHKLRITKETIEDSRGIQHFTKYSYLDEVPGSNLIGSFPSALFLMIHSNRIGHPIETLSGYIENNTEYIIGGTLDIYATNTFPANGVLNIKPYRYQTLSLSLSQPLNSNNYQPLNLNNGQLVYDPHYKLDCQYNYDIMDRLVSFIPFGKIETTYTWNGIYPATKTIGNQTYTYTYEPYVGIKTITNPRGVTTYYNYDSAGRLIEEYQIVNGNKQVLNVYQYHIKTE